MYSRDELAKQIGQKLVQAREGVGLSRADVGKRLGLTERGYGHIEAGRSLIGIEYLLQLPAILGKPITYFLPAAAVTDIERNNPLLDPKLRELIEALIALWPRLDAAAQEAIKDVVVALDEIVRNRGD